VKRSVKGELVLIWFVFGYGLYVFTGEFTVLPIATVLAPVFILHLLENQEFLEGWLYSVAGFIIALQLSTLSFLDLSGAPFWYYGVLRNIFIALALALPFWVTRLFYRKNYGFTYTLIFPLCTVATYFLFSKSDFFSANGGIQGYAWFGNQALMQVVSLGGLWLLVFILSWSSSMICWLWNNGFRLNRVAGGVMLYGVVLFLLIFYGSIRVSPLNKNNTNKTVRVASAVMPPAKDSKLNSINDMRNSRIYSDFENSIKSLEAVVVAASTAGSKIVLFQEYTIYIPLDQDKNLRTQLSRISQENGVYVVISYLAVPLLKEGLHETFMSNIKLDDAEKGINRSLMFDPAGMVIAEYQKKNLSLRENSWVLEGEGTVPVVETPYGKLALVMGRDMDFGGYIRSSAGRRVDIMLVSAFGTIKNASMAYSQLFRAVENGFSVVYATQNGLSYAVNGYGRIQGVMNSFTTSNRVMYVDVPVMRVNTIYGFIGDLFAWLCVVLFGFLVVNVFFPFLSR
jgi:apolipoprotein N-acyltransferase